MQLDYNVITAAEPSSLEKYLKTIPLIDGMVMEFGVYSGSSIRTIADNTDRTVYGFDSWQGLPENWEGYCYGNNATLMHPKGAFCSAPPTNLPENVVLVDGWFEDSLPPFLETHTENVAFAHIDCDLYSSTKTVLTNLRPRIVDGTILAFDELIGYGNPELEIWREHEWRAFEEFLADTNMKWECIGRQNLPTGVAFRVFR